MNDKIPNYEGQYKTVYQDYDGKMNPAPNNTKKPCCIVGPDQKVYMIDETTKSILENARPDVSQMILADFAKTAQKLDTLDGQEIYQVSDAAQAKVANNY